MKRLRLKGRFKDNMNTISGCDDEQLEYLRIEEDGKIYAVFADDSELDISELFPQTVLEDYQHHQILEYC